MYMTCGNLDAVTAFCSYCSTLEKVMETANVTMFVVGLDPSLGCRICEHITNIVNSDPDITEYRRTLDPSDRVKEVYGTQREWYRELTHNQTVTGDTSPPPSLHVTDIYLSGDIFGWDPTSDSDTVRLTGELMSANLGTIVSVSLRRVIYPLHGVIELLPSVPTWQGYLSAIKRTVTSWWVSYRASHSSPLYGILVVSCLMLLTVLLWRPSCHSHSWSGYGWSVLVWVTTGWGWRTPWPDWGRSCYAGYTWQPRGGTEFVTSLLALPQSVRVRLVQTDIDKGTVRRIKTSPRLTVTRDGNGYDSTLEFTTVPSLDNK